MPTEVILGGVAILILSAVLLTSRRNGRRHANDGTTGTFDGGSSRADCTGSASDAGGCGGGDGGGSD
jgi:hypothetical protein